MPYDEPIDEDFDDQDEPTDYQLDRLTRLAADLEVWR